MPAAAGSTPAAASASSRAGCSAPCWGTAPANWRTASPSGTATRPRQSPPGSPKVHAQGPEQRAGSHETQVVLLAAAAPGPVRQGRVPRPVRLLRQPRVAVVQERVIGREQRVRLAQKKLASAPLAG